MRSGDLQHLASPNATEPHKGFAKISNPQQCDSEDGYNKYHNQHDICCFRQRRMVSRGIHRHFRNKYIEAQHLHTERQEALEYMFIPWAEARDNEAEVCTLRHPTGCSQLKVTAHPI